MTKELIDVINYYQLRLGYGKDVYIVDTRTGDEWHFVGGYGDARRQITQPGCARVIAVLGDNRKTEHSIIGVLDILNSTGTEAQRGLSEVKQPTEIERLRAALDQAHAHIGALLGLPHVPSSLPILVAARAWLRREAK